MVGNLPSSFPLVAGLMQQKTLQGFIQGGEAIQWRKLDDVTALL